MSDEQFFNSLKTLLTLLESSQFQQLCDAAIEDGELTLGDAVQAIRYAAHSPIPTTNFN